MSTPTTATATLPPYHPHHFPYSHQQSYIQVSPSFRNANPLLPSASRLAAYPVGYSAASVNTGLNGVNLSTSASRSEQQESVNPTPRAELHYTAAMPTATQVVEQQPARSRKRRRSREPDWNQFYKNGLPKEVIVIDDDTPEPERSAVPASSTTLTNGYANGTNVTKVTNGTNVTNVTNGTNGTNGINATNATNGVNGTIATAGTNGTNGALSELSAQHPPAKKRRRDGESTYYDPVYHNTFVGSHTNTPHQNATPSKSTVSSDGASSVIHTTAATSLGSLSSGSRYDYDTTTQSQKRKRTTRQQVANEAKKRDANVLGIGYNSYQPPPQPPKKASEVHVKVIPDHSHNKSVRVDDDDGHYIVVPDADLTERYQIYKLLGQGTFGKVVQARDKRRNKLVAIKIIRSVQKYRDASKIELRVLATLKANDEENRNRCIHLRDCFDFRGHICIVMDLLGQSVFDFLKSNSFVPFPNSQIQQFAQQLFTSVAFLHDLNLIHTDLKPENILLCSNDYQTFTYNRKIPSSSTTVNRQATQRKVLLDTEIRLIDFGSATFQDEYHSSVVSTRHYRAPEIILGLGWSYPCDIWSIGCILVEFFTGDALFQTHDNLEHLAMMEAAVNARIDSHLVSQVNRMTRNGGNPASKYFKRLKLDYPNNETTRASRRFVKAMKKLDEIIPSNTKFLALFLDLLTKIFVYDPAHRITAKEALQHPWFREAPHPDDGSEAARIREERRRQQDMPGPRLPPIHNHNS